MSSAQDVYHPTYWTFKTVDNKLTGTFYGHPVDLSIVPSGFWGMTEPQLLEQFRSNSWFPTLQNGSYVLATTTVPNQGRFDYNQFLANNPGAHTEFYRTITTDYGTSATGCFIATAAYGTSMGKDLDTLRAFRDQVLPDELVKFYYRYSPTVAKAIARHDSVRWIIRQPFKVIARCLRLIGIG